MIGLCGAHRTGKSTLARAFAEKSGLPYVETTTSATFARLGFDPKAEYPFALRMEIQLEILKDAVKAYEKGGIKFITDRTPVDMMAYALADVQRSNVTQAEGVLLDQYLEKCIEVANQHFTAVIVVQPGIIAPDEPGKAPVNRAFMEHMNYLVKGIIISEDFEPDHFVIPRNMLKLEDRVKAVQWAVVKHSENHSALLKHAKETGVTFH